MQHHPGGGDVDPALQSQEESMSTIQRRAQFCYFPRQPHYTPEPVMPGSYVIIGGLAALAYLVSWML